MLQFMGSQRVGHDWVTEPNLTELIVTKHQILNIQTFTSALGIKAILVSLRSLASLFECLLCQLVAV